MSSPATIRMQRGSATAHSLDAVLRPTSIAIIGASPDPTKRGHRAVHALRRAGYAGRVIPVHPAGGELSGYPVARGPADVDVPVDLLLVCTPAPTVPAVLREWNATGARGAVVLASGFGESGADGVRIEQSLREAAAVTGIRVVGPNTSGILNVPLGVNLIGVEGVAAGGVGLLVQSGNLALALLTEATRCGVGFSCVIGVGNEVDIGFHEYLDYLAADPDTRVIAVHAEGFRNGAAFLAALRRVSAVKPVVVLKGARTDQGGASARSHTGAVAGSWAALQAGLGQAGAITALRSDELLPIASTLMCGTGMRPVDGVAILSDGGGHATLVVDDLHARGVSPAPLSDATMTALRTLLGPAAAVSNPIDLAGAADRDPVMFARALEVIAADDNIGIVLVVGLFGGYALRFSETLLDGEIDAARSLPEIARSAGVALIVHSLYARTMSEPLQVLQRAGIPVIESLESACRSVQAVLERRAGEERRARLSDDWPTGVSNGARDTDVSGTAFAEARADARSVLLEPEARALLEPYGLPLVPAVLCRTDAEIGAEARRLGEPVAIRVVSPSAPHKTEAGGVALRVSPSAAADVGARVFDAVRAWCSAHDRAADIRGALVSPMLRAPIAELLVGIVRDPQFGPVLTLGAGGTRVELEHDVATRVLPIGEAEIDDMLASLRIASILRGHRGASGVDTAAIRQAVLALVQCALDFPQITELEVNPLFAYADRALAVDVRVFIA